MNGFHHPKFARTMGQPHRSNLMELHKNLCKNSASVHSNLGGGNHDFLAIIIGEKDNLAKMGHAFISPINQGNYPNIPAHETEQHIKVVKRTHKQEILIFMEFLCVGKSLERQLTNTIKPIYMAFLKNELTGLNNVNIIQVMNYLCTPYGKVDGIKLETNKFTMMTVYTPKLTIAVLTNKLEEGQNFVWSRKKYITDAMMISKGITLLKNAGAFTNDIKEFNHKPDK